MNRERILVVLKTRTMLETMGRMTRSVRKAWMSEGKEDPLREPRMERRIEKEVAVESVEGNVTGIQEEQTRRMDEPRQTPEDEMPAGWFLGTPEDQRVESGRRDQVSTERDLEEAQQRLNQIRRDLNESFKVTEGSTPVNTENEVYPLETHAVDVTRSVPASQVPAIAVTRTAMRLPEEVSRSAHTNVTTVTTRVPDSEIYELQRALERLDPVTRRVMFEQLAGVENGPSVYSRPSNSMPVPIVVSTVETSTSAPILTGPLTLPGGRTIGWKPQPSLVGGGGVNAAGQLPGGASRLPYPSDSLRSGGVTNPIRSKSLSDGDRVNALVQLPGEASRLPDHSDSQKSGVWPTKASVPLRSDVLPVEARYDEDWKNQRGKEQVLPGGSAVRMVPYDTRPSRKQLSYPVYEESKDPDSHVQVFEIAIYTNRETEEGDKINLFGYTLRDNVQDWYSNFRKLHPKVDYQGLLAAFCKRFRKVQNDAQAYNMLKNIEQKRDEKVQQYYERFAKLVNSLQKSPDDGFLVTLFRGGLLPELIVATASMKRETLADQLDAAILCEEGMSDRVRSTPSHPQPGRNQRDQECRTPPIT